MFDAASRYSTVKESEITNPDGSIIRYKQRRFLPRSDEMSLIAEITITRGDRLDMIAARVAGDPAQFWRICDANDAMNPDDLMEIGRTLRVSMPRQ